MKKRLYSKEQEKIEDDVRKVTSSVMFFLADIGVEVGFSYDMLERCVRESLTDGRGMEDRERLLSVLEAMKLSAGKSGAEPRAITLAKRIVPALPNRDVWLITQMEEGGVLIESPLATVEVKAKSRGKK